MIREYCSSVNELKVSYGWEGEYVDTVAGQTPIHRPIVLLPGACIIILKADTQSMHLDQHTRWLVTCLNVHDRGIVTQMYVSRMHVLAACFCPPRHNTHTADNTGSIIHVLVHQPRALLVVLFRPYQLLRIKGRRPCLLI